MKDLTNSLIKVLIENGVDKTKKQIEKDLFEESYFNSERTIKYGLADQIMDKKVMELMLGTNISV